MSTKKFRQGVFISYSHKDKKWLDKLQTFLKPLVLNESLEIWSDTMIPPGSKWTEQIEGAIDSSRVAVLLVSPNFLASDFIASRELPRILERNNKDGLIILWIAVSYSIYKHTKIAQFQATNDPDRPLDSLSTPEQNKVLSGIADSILSATQVNAVANVFSIVDDFVPQADAFMKRKEEPPQGVQHRVMARQQDDTIVFEDNGRPFEVITAGDFRRLDSASQQLIRAHEYTMKDLFDRWTELKPKRVARDPKVRRDARRESEKIRRDLCAELNQVLDYIEFLGKQLQDHYHYARFICQK